MPGLPHAPSRVVLQLLRDLDELDLPARVGRSVDDLWKGFYSAIPDKPDQCVCVYDVTGRILVRNMRDGRHTIKHGVQIRVRSLTAEAGMAKGWALIRALEGVHRVLVQVGDALFTVHVFCLTGPPLYIGIEEGNRRHTHTLNGTVTLTYTE